MARLSRIGSTTWKGLSGTFAVLIAVAGALVAVTHGWARFSWVIAVIAMTAVQQYAQARRESADKQALRSAELLAEDARFVTNLAITDTFTPLLGVVARFLEATADTDRQQYHGRLVEAVVTAAVKIIGPDLGVRACYFQLDVDEGGAPLRLRPESSVGRADEPRSTFEAGTPAGDAAIAMVLDEQHLFCRDVEQDPPTGWDHHRHNYRTFLSVPVRGYDHVVGMLTVDSTTPGDLDENRDQPILRVLGRILALTQVQPRDA